MLLFVVPTVRPKRAATPLRFGTAERIELAASHRGERCAGITHAFGFVKRAAGHGRRFRT